MMKMYKRTKYVIMVKSKADLKKYGFFYNQYRDEWRFELNILRMSVDRNNVLHFNCITNEVLVVFMTIVQDDIVYYEELQKVQRYEIKLTEEEYKLILKRRAENEK